MVGEEESGFCVKRAECYLEKMCMLVPSPKSVRWMEQSVALSPVLGLGPESQPTGEKLLL